MRAVRISPHTAPPPVQLTSPSTTGPSHLQVTIARRESFISAPDFSTDCSNSNKRISIDNNFVWSSEPSTGITKVSTSAKSSRLVTLHTNPPLDNASASFKPLFDDTSNTDTRPRFTSSRLDSSESSGHRTSYKPEAGGCGGNCANRKPRIAIAAPDCPNIVKSRTRVLALASDTRAYAQRHFSFPPLRPNDSCISTRSIPAGTNALKSPSSTNPANCITPSNNAGCMW